MLNFINEKYETYVYENSTLTIRNKVFDTEILEFDLQEDIVKAKIKGSSIFKVTLNIDKNEIVLSSCNCLHDKEGICEHIIRVIHETDEEMAYNKEDVEEGYDLKNVHEYNLPNFNLDNITSDFIYRNSMKVDSLLSVNRIQIDVYSIEVNHAQLNYFTSTARKNIDFQINKEGDLLMKCACNLKSKNKMCEHQANILLKIKDSKELIPFFDKKKRYEIFAKYASEYGIEDQNNLDDFFELERKSWGGFEVVVKNPKMFPVNIKTKEEFRNLISLNSILPNKQVEEKEFLVFGFDKYLEGIVVGLYKANLTRDLKIKNPISVIPLESKIFASNDVDTIKFFSAIKQLSESTYGRSFKNTIESLQFILNNPLNFDTYIHNQSISQNISSNSIEKIQISNQKIQFSLKIDVKSPFYSISPKIQIYDKQIPIKQHKLKLKHFIIEDNIYYFINDISEHKLLNYFNIKGGEIVIHESKYEEFQKEVLDDVEGKIKIEYSYLKKPSKQILIEEKMNDSRERIVYLSELNDFILITPILKYGQTEVPILSNRQIQFTNKNGDHFYFERDQDIEHQMNTVIQNQHPFFDEQNEQDFYYLSYSNFLENDWFLDAFEEWQMNNYTILGFNKLNKFKYNQNKAKISVQVTSGTDWFDTQIEAKYGDQIVPLKELQKAVKNSTRFVQLGNGTKGILPKVWMDKFEKYFRNGNIENNILKTPKSNFLQIQDLYEKESLDETVLYELNVLRKKLESFKNIRKIKQPKDLNATLRDYQKEGLNWLNFLDEFNFGGCLADDMGLGKTIQIIAFLLSQRSKRKENVNLIIVPTSLIFNWVKEIEKFAPSLKVLTIYGAKRKIDFGEILKNEIILTSYGTILSDISKFKDFYFNYIILDESQYIKNPESQRYKAVKLLSSRNKLVLTGTPIENNTFDLYAQLSFANPGLLGTKQHFRDNYSIPIDKFKETKRAKELQLRINPFILRRTKLQVAKELPDKTEMVLYCEMGKEQRSVYEAYRQEIKEYFKASTATKQNIDSVHVLAAMTKLRQICNSPALINDEEYYGNESAKIAVLMEEIQERNSNHKILVFSQFTSMLDLIKSELDKNKIGYTYLTGQTKNREEVVKEFQQNEQKRVFLISLKAGGVGLNLTQADYVYLVDPWWNPAVENQAIDRCYRIGQDKHVVAIRLITPDSIEEKIINLQSTKKDLSSDLIHTEKSILKSLSKEDIIDLFK